MMNSVIRWKKGRKSPKIQEKLKKTTYLFKNWNRVMSVSLEAPMELVYIGHKEPTPEEKRKSEIEAKMLRDWFVKEMRKIDPNFDLGDRID